MAEAIFKREAVNDLAEIAREIGRHSPATAARIIRLIRSKANHYAALPDSGISRDDLLPGLRCFVVKRYLIFYRKDASSILVLRVLHGSRDTNTIMAPSSSPL